MRRSQRSAATRPRPQVAIVHDYLTQRGGAERVVLAMAKAFPDAPIYTTLYDAEATFPEFAGLDIRVSPLNRMGLFRRHHRAALPVLRQVVSRMTVPADVVLASSSGWAHGVQTPGRKIVYCYSPARWLYQSEVYLGDKPQFPVRLALAVLERGLRSWDRRAARSADKYLAISSAVQERIRNAYDLDSEIVPAPFTGNAGLPTEPVPAVSDWSGYYLCIARLLPYKNVDKVVRAFAGSSRRLVVVGSGPDEDRLRSIAGDNVRLVKDLSDAQMRWLYRNCQANVSASFEDYGLTPLEAAVYGKPSVVLRWGGFLDTMIDGKTCVYFDSPEPRQIADALTTCEQTEWSADLITEHIGRYTEDSFALRLQGLVEDQLAAAPRQ